MKHKMRLLPAMILVILLAAPAGLSAQMLLSSQNHDFNPALFAFSPRGRFEIGLNAQATGYNTAFALGDVLQETFIIDADKVIETVGDTGLRLGTDLVVGSHITAHAFGYGLGAYGRTENIAEIKLPIELFEMIAQGNVENGESVTRSGTGGVILHSFAETGAYVSGRYRDYTIGLKAARFVPVVYSDGAEFRFEVGTGEDGFSGSADFDIPMYSAFDLAALDNDDEEFDAASGFANGGFKLDIGVIRRDADGRAWWGASINDLSIVRASGLTEFKASAGVDFESEDLIDSLFDDDSEPFDLETEDLDIEFVGDSDKRIGMPLSVSGFYRFDFPWVDITPHAEAVFHSEVGGLNPGLTISGNRFPTSLFYVGAERSRLAWRAGAGLRIPLYIAELGLHVQSASRTIGGVFGPQGMSADLNLRIGF